MGDLAITPTGQMGDADAAKRLRSAANQMEGMFLGLLFKQLEEAKDEDSELYGDSSASQQFNQIFHSALTEKAAGGMGIADAVFQQLAVKAGIKQTSAPVISPQENKP